MGQRTANANASGNLKLNQYFLNLLSSSFLTALFTRQSWGNDDVILII